MKNMRDPPMPDPTKPLNDTSMPAARRPALVIFDCDGVLIDSEPISLAVLTAGLNRIGVTIDVDAVRARYAGTSMTSIMDDVARRLGILPPEGFVASVKADTLHAFDAELRAMPGALAMIEALDIPYCVASSSDPVRLRHSLGLTGLLPHVEGRLFSSSMVARGKPFPDLFLHAAGSMGAAASDCLVVEDSVPGTLAARAAGMRVLGFTGGGHWQHDRQGDDLLAAGAERVCGSFDTIAALLLRS